MTKFYPRKKPSETGSEKETQEACLLKVFDDAAGDIKGRWAEEFFKLILRSIKYKYVNTGVEDAYKELVDLFMEGEIHYGVLKNKSKNHDLAVVLPRGDKRYRKVIAVEVKYRDKGKIKVSELMAYQSQFHKYFRFVFFDRENIYVLDPKDIQEKAKTLGKGTAWQDDYILFKYCKRLHNAELFEFSDENKMKVRGFEQMSASLFNNLPNKSTLMDQLRNWLTSVRSKLKPGQRRKTLE